MIHPGFGRNAGTGMDQYLAGEPSPLFLREMKEPGT